jgi:hypothetical protein
MVSPPRPSYALVSSDFAGQFLWEGELFLMLLRCIPGLNLDGATPVAVASHSIVREKCSGQLP